MKGVEASPMGATFEHQEVLNRPSLCREAAEICMLRSRGEAARMIELQRHKFHITLIDDNNESHSHGPVFHFGRTWPSNVHSSALQATIFVEYVFEAWLLLPSMKAPHKSFYPCLTAGYIARVNSG